MWITDFLQSGLQTGNTQNAQNVQITTREQLPAALQKEIRALSPGQILSGQILERSGNELKLLVNFSGSELELQARLEQNIALTMGKNILFQVKNNGSSLSLSPLFENMGMEANAQKALDMASLPVNDTTMELTGQLMREGMPIDKEALQGFYREVNTYADAEIMDIIDLHKLGLEVNAENLEQLGSYKNMTHQLMGGINEISQQLPELFREMSAQGMDGEINRLLKTLLLQEDGSPAAGISQWEEKAVAQDGDQMTMTSDREEQMSLQGEKAGMTAENSLQEEPLPAYLRETPEQAELSGRTTEGAELSGKATEGAEMLRNDPQPGEDTIALSQEQESAGKDAVMQKLTVPQNLLREAAQALAEGKELSLKELVKSPDFQRQLQQFVKQELTVRPEDTSKEKVDEVYRRLSRQLGALSEAISSAGQESGTLGRTVQNLQQNLNFLNQLNDLYSYVQLPLKMMDNDTHGELYVYTNKRKQAVREGEISALLHLDMANLGPMDVYVQLRDDKVSTRFYLPDEEMLDFIAEHIDLLNTRLEKRGYHMNCSFQMRETGEENTVMQELIEEQSNRPVPSDYSFDAFA